MKWIKYKKNQPVQQIFLVSHYQIFLLSPTNVFNYTYSVSLVLSTHVFYMVYAVFQLHLLNLCGMCAKSNHSDVIKIIT